MPIPREQTPFHRRLPTIPVPASRQSVVPVPFDAAAPASAHATPPPPSSPTSPLSPLPPPSALTLIPSSSTNPPDLEVHSSRCAACGLPAAPPPLAAQLPRTTTLYELPAARHASLLRELASSGSPSPGRRSPPSAPSSPSSSVAVAAAAEVSFPEPDYVERIESGSEETVESDNSGIDWDSRSHSFDAWVSPGDRSLTERLVVATVNRPEEISDLPAFLSAAISSALPSTPFELLQYSGVTMVVRFAFISVREAACTVSPVQWEGHALALDRPEEAPSRSFFVPGWLAEVSLSDFPLDRWREDKIRECFVTGCRVVEINPAYLSGNDFRPIQLVLEVNHYLDVPYEVNVCAVDGIGRDVSVVQVLPLRVWPREDQLGPDGNLLPIYNQEPPPPPTGPVSEPDAQDAPPQPPMPPQLPPDADPQSQRPAPDGTATLRLLALAAAFAQLARQVVQPPTASAETVVLDMPLPRSPSLAHYIPSTP